METKIFNKFTGFSKMTFDFLMNIEFNNNKMWFEENKQNYKDYVVKPFQELIIALSSYMLSIDPAFDTRPEISKTISRIYRDVRFSKDKSPYRSSVWLTFKRLSSDWKLEPCFFFEITPSFYRYGMGFFVLEKETILKLRESIDKDREEFRKIFALYNSQNIFTLAGEKYKKILDKSKSEEILNWYQRKEIYFLCEKKLDKELFGSQLVETLKRDFDILKPFYEYLWKLKES
jgi:uncharacterized protein (TIGR02453 family)